MTISPVPHNIAMRITVCCSDTKTAPWIDALRAALPGATVEEWRPGAPQADHAMVWAPPQQFLDEQPGLKGIFNIGAGVDALMKLALPRDAVVVRLDDAGMSVQMAEFVCHAVIRHFREFDAYERDAAQGQWGFRRPRRRSEFPVGVMGLGVLAGGTSVLAAAENHRDPAHLRPHLARRERRPGRPQDRGVRAGRTHFRRGRSKERILKP